MTGPVRSLNQATAVGIVLYDSLRRLGYTSDFGIPHHHHNHRVA
jgi:tRNA(Leu) C34 or U34 (ribose-2'-O)-methylase TrmL